MEGRMMGWRGGVMGWRGRCDGMEEEGVMGWREV